MAIGTKLIVHSWDGHSLMPVAFFDTLHTVTMNVVKNFILLGDIQKGAFSSGGRILQTKTFGANGEGF